MWLFYFILGPALLLVCANLSLLREFLNSAICDCGSLEPGARVRVHSVQGNTLYVLPVDPPIPTG